MSQFFAWIFRIGIVGFLVFAVSATIGSLEDFGLELPEGRESALMKIFGWGGMLFITCGIVLWLETIAYIRSNWSNFSPLQKFVSTIGFLAANIAGGYIYHFFAVSMGEKRKPSK